MGRGRSRACSGPGRSTHHEPAAAGAGAARGGQWRAALRRGRGRNPRPLTAKLANSALPRDPGALACPRVQAARAARRANMAAE